MLAKIELLLVFNPILAAGFAQAPGAAAGIIQGIGSVSVFGGLVGAGVSAIRPESPHEMLEMKPRSRRRCVA